MQTPTDLGDEYSFDALQKACDAARDALYPTDLCSEKENIDPNTGMNTEKMKVRLGKMTFLLRFGAENENEQNDEKKSESSPVKKPKGVQWKHGDRVKSQNKPEPFFGCRLSRSDSIPSLFFRFRSI